MRTEEATLQKTIVEKLERDPLDLKKVTNNVTLALQNYVQKESSEFEYIPSLVHPI